MAIVVNKANPAATTTPDDSVKFAQSLADPHYATVGTGGVDAGVEAVTDDRGGTDHTLATSTGVDFAQAGTDLDR